MADKVGACVQAVTAWEYQSSLKKSISDKVRADEERTTNQERIGTCRLRWWKRTRGCTMLRRAWLPLSNAWGKIGSGGGADGLSTVVGLRLPLRPEGGGARVAEGNTCVIGFWWV